MPEKNDEKEEIAEYKWYNYPPMRNALIAGLLLAIGFVLARFELIPSTAEILIDVFVILLGGYYWSKEGVEKLFKEKEIGIEILMMAATLGAAILGFWEEAAFLAFLYGGAEALEEYTFARTRASVRKLLELAPKEARVLRNGKEVVIPAEKLELEDIFIVRPGESIPTDGIIQKGKSSINESAVTGESIPVEKKEGMNVFAATINQEGALEIKVTATFEDNTLSKMVHLVEEAQERKSKAQRFIETFGRRYSPLVLLSALILIIFPQFFGANFSEWSTRAVVFLVAAAPCALVMSTPVAIAAGIGKSGRKGVLIKGGIHLENLGRVKAVAFDKTGTLTRGKAIVTDIMALNGDKSESDILSLAYSIEKYSEHPLAQAIVKKAEELGIESLNTSDFNAIAGYGAQAEIGNETIYVGNQRLFEKMCAVEYVTQIEKLRNEGKTVILVGNKRGVVGIIAIRDEIRDQAKRVVKELHNMGIKVAMLTGDNEITARAIAKELGIDDVRADLRPTDKIDIVKKLEQEYGAVAMVGDGINDAPALARATVGIAMGTAGTDAAIEAADTALMSDDLTKVVYAINLGKLARRISYQNIVFSMIILAVLIPSSLIGIMTVAIAVLFHETSELLAVANGLRVAGG